MQVFGMGTVMILIRHFSDQPETYGVWVLYLMVASFIEVSRNGLIQSAKIRYLNGASDENYRKINTSSAFLNLGLTLLIGMLLLLGSDWLSVQLKAPGLGRLLRIYLLTNLVLIPFVQFNFLQQANLQFRGIFVANFIRQGLYFLFVAGLALSGQKISLEILAWGQLLFAAMASGVAWHYAKPFLRYAAVPNAFWSKRLLKFGAYTFGTSLSTMLYKTIDRLMLGILMPTQAAAMQAVAVFDPAMRITNIMEIPIQSMASVTFPQSAKRMAEEGRTAVKELYERSVGVLLALMIPLCAFVLIFPDFLVVIVAGKSEAYSGAAAILQVTILYTLFVPYARQFGIAMDTIEKPNINFYFILLGAAMNIVSNYFLIREFGVIGAAYGTLLTIAVRFVLQQIFLNIYLGVNTFKPLIYSFGYMKYGVVTGIDLIRHPSKLKSLRERI